MAAMASTDKFSVRLGTSGHIKLKKAVLVSFLLVPTMQSGLAMSGV